MNIVELAKEAGCHASVITGAICFNPEVLERFAALVRADERDKVKKVLMAAHELSKQYHNYYHYIALQLDDAMEKLK